MRGPTRTIFYSILGQAGSGGGGEGGREVMQHDLNSRH